MFGKGSNHSVGLIVAWGILSLSATVQAEDKPIVVTAAKLAQVYATDPTGFDKTYKGKMVEIEGVVEIPDAQDSISKKHFVMLHGFQKKGDPAATTVRCEISKDLEGLKASQTVRIRGTCRGHNKFLFAAEINDCTLVKKK